MAMLVAAFAGACKKKEAGTGTGTATGTGTGTASGSRTGTGTGAVPPVDAAPAARADVAAFTAVFDPLYARLDHVERARTSCEARAKLLEAVNAIDKATPPAGREAQAWLEGVEAVQVAIDEMGDPCDEGNIKAIEAKLESAKASLNTITK